MITRAALEETLARGPGAFLGTIRVRATSTGKVFHGWQIIDVPPGAHTILLHFDTPAENATGRWLTLASLGLVATLIIRRKKS